MPRSSQGSSSRSGRRSEMRPVLFTWRRLEVHSYPSFLYLGLVCGVYAGYGAAAYAGLDPERTATGILILLVPALAGARAWFVMSHWRGVPPAPPPVRRPVGGGAGHPGRHP